MRGIVLWLIALGISLATLLSNEVGLVPRESVYANPSLPFVIAALSFSAVILGFDSTKLAVANRDLRIGRPTQIEIISQLAGISSMLILLMFGRSIWVLVAGSICVTVVSVCLGHLWLPGDRNKWAWDKSAAVEIYHFGKWIIPTSMVGIPGDFRRSVAARRIDQFDDARNICDRVPDL